jgi:uncharacterized protein (TIGR03435 family)
MRLFPALLLPALLSAQTRPAFEVTSVKPRGGSQQFLAFRSDPGGVHLEGPLRFLIRFAYGVQDFQLEGVSGWMDSEFYVVEGKTTGNHSPQEMNRMVQSLLEDRFALKMHRETREGPVYSLVVARGGSKLKPSVDSSCVMRTPGNPDPGSAACGYRPGLGTLDAKGVVIADLAGFLSALIARPVVDKTGLRGRFDFHLEYAIDQATAGLQAPAAQNADADNRPTIFTAVQEYLGLQLRSDKGPREYLVVDHAEKPAEN